MLQMAQVIYCKGDFYACGQLKNKKLFLTAECIHLLNGHTRNERLFAHTPFMCIIVYCQLGWQLAFSFALNQLHVNIHRVNTQ